MASMRLSTLALAALAAALITTPALAEGPAKVIDTAKGKAFADAKGMALYTYDRDAKGVSNCDGRCAEKWPPAMAGASDKADGKWTIIKRKDGTMQWAYDGKPVYRWIRDKKPGDVKGDGVGKVWHLAKPD